MSAETEAAEARGLARAARKLEESGKTGPARNLYLEAAARFLSASKNEGNAQSAGLRHDLAESFYAKALHLTPAAKEVSMSTNGTGTTLRIEALSPPDVTFRDVAGMEQVKKAIRQAIILPLKRPDLFEHYRRRAGDGILLYGPPGCGKTYIARAAAGEAGIPFYNLRISDVLSKWVGDSERNLRAFFEAARAAAPSMVFIDELDALARRRGDDSNGASDRLVNEFLTLLDGAVQTREKGVLIVGATNEPWSVDAAFRRPGRFTRLLFVPAPDFEARLDLMKICSRSRPLAPDVDLERLAARTNGYSAADVKQVCDDAADVPLLEALDGGHARPIAMADFSRALANRTSSLPTWINVARQRLAASGEAASLPELEAFLRPSEAPA